MANTDGKIYITITDHPVGSSYANVLGETKTTQASGIANKTPEQENQSVIGDYAKHRLYDFVKSQATQQINYSLSNIGNFTGNFQEQRDAQFAMSVGNFFMNTAMAGIAGFKIGGLVGAGVAMGIAVAGQGITYARQENAGRIMNAQTNREITILRQISGLDTLTNGGRI